MLVMRRMAQKNNNNSNNRNEADSASNLYKLASQYAKGAGVENLAKAAELYAQAAADLGDVAAMAHLGFFSLLGANGVAKDRRLAHKYTLLARDTAGLDQKSQITC